MSETNEVSLILACARIHMMDTDLARSRELCAQPLEWDRVLNLAAINRLGPLMYRNLQEARLGTLIPPNVINALKSAYHISLSRNIRLEGAVREALNCLNDGHIQTLMLRGPAVGEIVFGDSVLRPYSDLDLLVRKDDLPRVKRVLAGLGYAPSAGALDDRYYERHHLHLQYRNPAGAEIEIHWALDHKYTPFNIRYEELFEEATPGTLAGSQALLMSPEHLLLTLCIHLIKHAYSAGYLIDRPDFAEQVISASWLMHVCDIAETLRHFEKFLNWPQVIQKTISWHIESAVQPSLVSAVRLFKAPVPEEALTFIPAPYQGWIEKKIYKLAGTGVADSTAQERRWRHRFLGFKSGLVFRPVRALDLIQYLWPDAGFLEGRYGVSGRWQIGLFRCIHFLSAVGKLLWNLWDLAYFSLKKKMERKPKIRPTVPPSKNGSEATVSRSYSWARLDHANTCNGIARAINRCNGPMQARVITLQPHPFEYEEDIVLQLGGAEEAGDVLQQADWIINSGDGVYEVFDRLLKQFKVNRRRVNLATRHAGSAYRNHVEQFNDWDRRQWKFKRRFMACDLYRFVLDDPRARIYLNPPGHIAGEIVPLDGPVRISHSPSDRGKKGTDSILRAVESCKRKMISEFEFDLIENVPHQECSERKNRSHIFVDQNSPEIGGFGSSTLEAMADGLAVLCNWSHVVPEVGRWIDPPPILMITSEADIERTLTRLLTDRALLEQQRRKSLAWAKKHLTPEFTYRHWWRCLTSDQ